MRVVFVWLVAAFPAVALTQSPEVPVPSLSVSAGLHVGQFGGRNTGGWALTAAGWRMTSPTTALRADLTYSYNYHRVYMGCSWGDDDCPTNGPILYTMAFGGSAMFGKLSAAADRYYVHAGGEFMIVRGRGYGDGGFLGVPKVGAGVFLMSQSMNIELTGRLRSWRDRPLHYWVLAFGWYR